FQRSRDHGQHQMTTDKAGLDRTNAWRAIATDRSHEDEAKVFDKFAPLCGERRCHGLKVGPLEHCLLQVDGCTHNKETIFSVSHLWTKRKMMMHILVFPQRTALFVSDELV